MFNDLISKMFKQQHEDNIKERKELLKQCILHKAYEADVHQQGTWDNIKWLNKHGLLKYFKTPDETVVVLYPTLLTSYLTLLGEKSIDEIYSESEKLYNLVGEIYHNGTDKR